MVLPMCQKQCRDENGFKCHLTSESHKRQMMVFGENPMRGEAASCHYRPLGLELNIVFCLLRPH